MKRAAMGSAILLVGLWTALGFAETVVVGTTVPVSKVDVPSVLRGQLSEVFVKEGQAVKKGEPLCKLDDELQRLTVKLKMLDAQSKVEIDSAQAQVDYADNELKRFQAMGRAGAPAELRQKELNLVQAKLTVQQKKEQADQKQVDFERESLVLKKMTIVSPLDGSVLRIEKQPGEAIGESDKVATVVDITRLQVPFFLDKTFFGRVKVGDHVTLDLATDPASKRDATVTTVDPIIDPSAPIFRVKVEFDNHDQSVPAGIAARWVWP